MESSRVTVRSQEFMSAVWEHRNNGADTENKLVAAILFIAAEFVQAYNAQDGRIVLDKGDLIQLAEELNE